MGDEFPWNKLARGEGFFVPTLDVEGTLLAGLKAGILLHKERDKPLAEIGIYKGQLGVMFYRRQALSARRKRARS